MAASSQVLFASSFHPIAPSRFSRTTVTCNLQNVSQPAVRDKWKVASYQASVSSPSDLNRLNNFADSFETLHEQRLKEVRHIVGTVEKCSSESLLMLDALQRLGIAYRFEDEIHSILREQHLIATDNIGRPGINNLYEVALRFRLLRQEGYYVPADIFWAFRSKQDNHNGGFTFNRKLNNDILGLTSLYEASLLGMHGEDILDEAATFSKNVLNGLEHRPGYDISNGINIGASPRTLREIVSNTLSNPFHTSLPRFNSKNFKADHFKLGQYEWTMLFRELAVLHSDLIASVNRDEIRQVSRWWTDLGLAKELKLARDQPLKWYAWTMAMLTDPKLSQERVDLTKPIAMIYIIDDIFDVYGSLDELTLFTEAIKRWECMEELPDYMKTCFRALHDITDEISFNVYIKHGWNPTELLRKSWMRLCDAFLVEARWLTSGHSPAADEYLENATVTSGVHIVIVHLFAFLCESMNNIQCLDELMNGFQGVSSSTGKILRLWDDLGSAKDENQEGRDGSYVDYYMKENSNCSPEEARNHVKKMISDSWKSLNKECLFPHRYFSRSVAKACLNMARMVPLMYEYDENHCLPRIEEYMKSLLPNGSVWGQKLESPIAQNV